MEIHKLGGASINSFNRIKSLLTLFRKHIPSNSIIIVSAIGKTTSQLEKLVNYHHQNKTKTKNQFNKIKNYHFDLIHNLFEKNNILVNDLNKLFEKLNRYLKRSKNKNFDYDYDQIVSYGELISSKVISTYLTQNNIKTQWLDVRTLIKTDNNYRSANVNWVKTKKCIKTNISNNLIVTQGFIGADSKKFSTTLGREGSDYTAAIFSNILNAKKTTIWKDVQGVFTADPSFFKNTALIQKLDYYDAIELAFYGAKIIHPKTIQPLKEKNIPLHVRSFLKPNTKGTVIYNCNQTLNKECIILKNNQFMISVSSLDFSFIEEKNISKVFSLFSKHNIKVNLMQNSSISFSVCIDNESKNVTQLISELKINFKVKYNSGLQLITIKNGRPKSKATLLKKKEILLEQKSRKTTQYIIR